MMRDIHEITLSTIGYSGADGQRLQEAAMGPIRSKDISLIETLEADQVRAISKCDLVDALRQVQSSVSDQDPALPGLNEKYGAGKNNVKKNIKIGKWPESTTRIP